MTRFTITAAELSSILCRNKNRCTHYFFCNSKNHPNKRPTLICSEPSYVCSIFLNVVYASYKNQFIVVSPFLTSWICYTNAFRHSKFVWYKNLFNVLDFGSLPQHRTTPSTLIMLFIKRTHIITISAYI